MNVELKRQGWEEAGIPGRKKCPERLRTVQGAQLFLLAEPWNTQGGVQKCARAKPDESGLVHRGLGAWQGNSIHLMVAWEAMEATEHRRCQISLRLLEDKHER